MAEAPFKSAFARDPDLDPIIPPPGAEILAAEAAPVRLGPKVEPAEPRTWETTFDLAFPLMVDGERLDRLTIRRLTGQQVAELILEDDDAASLNVRVRAAMAGVHPAVIAGLEADDAEAFVTKCRPLLPAALARLEEQIRADAAGEI